MLVEFLMSINSVLSASELFRIEAGGRLVEAEQFRSSTHGAGDFEATLVAIGQRAGRLVGTMGQLRLVEPELRQLDRLGCGCPIAANADEAEHRVAGRLHQLVVLRHQQVLQHGHAGEEADILEGPGHLGAGVDFMPRQPLEQEGLAVTQIERQHAFGRLVEAGDAVEDGRLAGAVRADQRGDLSALCLERDVADGDEPAEAHRQVIDAQDGVGIYRYRRHQPCPSLVKEAETALRSCRNAVGSRLPTKPRGFHSITMIIARPNSSMR